MTAFTTAEYEERLGRARQALTEAGMEAAICVSPETLLYLAGYGGYTYWTEQAYVYSAGSDHATLILRDTDLALAREAAVVADVRTYRLGKDDPAMMVRDVLEEMHVTLASTIGIEKQSYALTASYYDRLVSLLQRYGSTVDCSTIMSKLRVRKSAAELEFVRVAAGMANEGMKAAIIAVQPGATEVMVAAAIEQALREAGSDYSSMPTILSSGNRTVSPHATPTARHIEATDPVLFNFAGVCNRYHVTAYRTVHVGRPPRKFVDLYQAAEEALHVLEDSVKLGRPTSAAATAAFSALRSTGYDRYQVARWGYGVGIAFPPVWLEAFDVTEESTDVFEANTLMCLHVCLSAPDDGFGLMIGGDYLLMPSGLECLDRIGTDLTVIAQGP